MFYQMFRALGSGLRALGVGFEGLSADTLGGDGANLKVAERTSLSAQSAFKSTVLAATPKRESRKALIFQQYSRTPKP